MKVFFTEAVAQTAQGWDCLQQTTARLKRLSFDALPRGEQSHQTIRQLVQGGQHRSLPFWRSGDREERVIFWAGSLDRQEIAILFLAGERGSVYRRLGESLPGFTAWVNSFATDDWEACLYHQLLPSSLESALDPLLLSVQSAPCFELPTHFPTGAALARYIEDGIYRYLPLLSEGQKQLVRSIKGAQWHPYKALLSPVQGCAGTGKTSVAMALAKDFVEAQPVYAIYPVVVLPTLALRQKTQRALAAQLGQVAIATTVADLVHGSDSRILLITRDQLLQELAGDVDPACSLEEATQQLQTYVAEHHPSMATPLAVTLAYGLLRGYSGDPDISYPVGDPSLVPAAAARLHDIWQPELEATVFAGRDPYAQAQRALHRITTDAQPLRASSRRFIFILDEVQDYYWFQLKPLLLCAQRTTLTQPLVVLLGDENQRVTLSGFTWSGLAHACQTQLGVLLPQRVSLIQNFRNTVEIATLARYLLLEGFEHLLPPLQDSQPRFFDPGDPLTCRRHGLNPRLHVVEEIDPFLSAFQHLMTTYPDHHYVCVVPPDSDWGERLQALDPHGTTLAVFTVAETKGQEFDAVILVQPFRDLPTALTPDALFQWYSTLTRARRYVLLLLAPAEHQWLQDQPTYEAFARLMDTVPLPIADLMTELQEAAQTTLTTEQKRHKVLSTFWSQLAQWLEGGIVPQGWRRLLTLGWDPWQVLTALSTPDQELVFPAIAPDAQPSLPSGGDIFDLLMLFWGCRVLEAQKPLLLPWRAWETQVLSSLGQYFQDHPADIPVALHHGDPEWQSFVYRATGQSGAAAIHSDRAYRQHHFQRMQAIIRAISEDLDQQGLSLEAQRWRVFAQLEVAPPTLYPELFQVQESLPLLLCQHLRQTLTALFPDSLPSRRILHDLSF